MDPVLIAVSCLVFTVLGLAFVIERIWQIVDRWRDERRKERLRWK
jgi:hypothetical protein